MLRRLHRVARQVAASLCLVACAQRRIAAQATTAELRGRVFGPESAALGGAHVEVRGRETGVVRQALTQADGAYRVLGLTPGSYDVIARAVGCRPERRADVELIVGEIVRVDFMLASSTSAAELEPVIVTANSTSDIERTDVSAAVRQREIERLPLNSRDALALAATVPGVRIYAPEAGRGTATTGAPASGRFVNLYVDGSEWKGTGLGGLVGQPGAGSLIPQEAIREFRVALNPYDVEFAHGAAWVMSAVTHQGGNEVRGSLFAYGQDRDLVARGTHQLVKPSYARSQIGANVRGPLLRDHLFFAASYEGQITDNYIDVVPGRPTNNPGLWDRYAGTYRAPFRNQLGMARLTAQLGSHTLDAIWLGRRLTALSNFGTQSSGTVLSYDAALSNEYRVSNGELRDRLVSGGFISELSLSVLDDHESDTPRLPGVTDQYPGIQMGRASYPLISLQRSITLAERISYTLTGKGGGGQHALKAGIEQSRIWNEGFQPATKDGFFMFPTDTSTLPSMAQIGVGYPDPNTTDGARADGTGWSTGVYAQDEWRPTPTLSVTTGLRYDADIHMLNQGRQNPWASDTTLQRVFGARYLDSRHRRNDLDNLAPRIAMRWDVGGAGRTSLRSGYGLMYDRIPRSAAFFERISWSWRTYTFRNPGTTDPAELRQRVLANQGTLVPPGLQLLPDRMDTPRSRQWSVGLGQRLASTLTLQMDYLDQRFVDLPVTVRTNAGQNRLTTRFGPIFLWGSFGDAMYRAVLSSLTMTRGSSRWTLAYTLGWSSAEFNGTPDAGYPDSASYTMQWSSTDERHRIVLSGITDGPWGLQFSTIAMVASPHPYGVIVGTDVNRSGVITDDWPNGIRTRRDHGWANWYRTVDIRIGKSLGRGRLIATADVFNLFNSANHSEYRNAQNQPDYGQPIGDYARRQAQLGMRYQF
jgi:hypothetical protein